MLSTSSPTASNSCVDVRPEVVIPPGTGWVRKGGHENVETPDMKTSGLNKLRHPPESPNVPAEPPDGCLLRSIQVMAMAISCHMAIVNYDVG